MAQITIRERDLTGNPAASTFDVAVVPGLRTTSNDTVLKEEGKWDDSFYGTPIYFDTVSDFQEMMGEFPVQLTGAGIAYDYTAGTGITTKNPEFEEVADFTTTNSTASGVLVGEEGRVLYGTILSTEAQITAAGLSTAEVAPVSALDNIDHSTFESFETYTLIPVQPKINDTFFWDADEVKVTGVTGDIFTASYSAASTVKVSVGGEAHNLACFGIIEIGPTETGEITIESIEGGTTQTLSAAELYGGFSSNTGVAGLPFPISVTDVTYSYAPSTDGYFFKAGEYDPGYVYACELLYAGMPIYYIPIEGTTAQAVYRAMEGTAGSNDSIFDQLRDRGTFNVKYLTTGGYPVYEYNENSIVTKILEVAGAANDVTDDYLDYNETKITNGRGDCVALIDHFEIDERNLLGAGSVFARVNGDDECGLSGKPYLSYGAMFTPYAKYDLRKVLANDETQITTFYLPASFAYMTCLAKQLNGPLPTYEAIAGVGRATVENIHFNTKTNKYEMCTKEVLSNYIANHMNSPMVASGDQTISINAITQINPYGEVIWGDRTLLQKHKVLGVKATGILNIRNMVSDIKKQMYQTARRYMFSANNDALWINFRNGVIGLLNQMQSGYGIKSYSLRKDTEKSTKAALYVLCSIQPVYPVEKFDITIEITDEEIEVEETATEA